MRTHLVAALIFFSGTAVGFYAAVAVFAIDVDLLGAPYSNTTVQFSKDRILKQGESQVLLPAGTKLTYSYSIKGVPIYSLNIVGGFGEQPPETKETEKPYFYADVSQ